MFSKLSIAEGIAAVSALCLTIAISRIIGYFVVIDVRLVGIIDMSDVVAASFYVAPYVLVPVVIAHLFFEGSEEPEILKPHESRLDKIMGRGRWSEKAIKRRNRMPSWVIKALVFGVGVFVVITYAATYWYTRGLENLVIGAFLFFFLVFIWRSRYMPSIRPNKIVISAIIVVVFSFGIGLQEGQFAIDSPVPNHVIQIGETNHLVHVSRITHSHVFFTDEDNLFNVVPLSEVSRFIVASPASAAYTNF